MSQVILTKISDHIMKKLENLSQETEQTKTFHINKAIEIYIHNYTCCDIAFDRLCNRNDEVISSKEMIGLLDL